MNFGLYPRLQVARSQTSRSSALRFSANCSGICMLLHSHRSDLVDAHILFTLFLPKFSHEARMKEAPLIRSGMPRLRFWRRLPGKTKVNQRNHDWSQNSPAPENPSRGEVFDEE
jgi:hypothetical protein